VFSGAKDSCVYAGLTILKYYRILGVLFLICACGGDCCSYQGDDGGAARAGVTRASLYKALSADG
jgi:hypothetical protein